MRTIIALVLAAGFFCCGPKLTPATYPTCVGEVCQVDDLGEHDCFCPEDNE